MKISDIKFCEIAYRSEMYHKALQLRYRLLRKPLKRDFDDEQLATEWRDYHLAVLDKEGNLIGCLLLSPKSPQTIKMRQVAVETKWHGRGVGMALVTNAERFARARGYRLMFCHARAPVVAFYEKLGYHTEGPPFEEVGITHYYMEKAL